MSNAISTSDALLLKRCYKNKSDLNKKKMNCSFNIKLNSFSYLIITNPGIWVLEKNT